VTASLALLDLDADRPIGIVDQFSDSSLVAKGRPVLLLGLDREKVVGKNFWNLPAVV
jgi:hypothetical protein